MGLVKQMMIEELERGYYSRDTHICADCVSDEYLKDRLRSEATSQTCSYCDRRSKKPIAADFDVLMECVMGAISVDWNDPDSEGISYQSSEGGYLAELYTAYDIVSDLEVTEKTNVYNDIVYSLGDSSWVEKDYYAGSSDLHMKAGWAGFCHIVKTKQRYTFLLAESNDDEPFDIPVSRFLQALASYRDSAAGDDEFFIRTITPSEPIYRVRVGKTKHSTAEELAAPPAELATQPNRMSPSGIPMFYGALDKATAIQETFDPTIKSGAKYISIGCFHSTKPLQILDLSTLPNISIFDPERNHLIAPLRFFRSFAQSIAEPIKRDGREHIEYVPTQIVTEYFRHVYKLPDHQKIDGIAYKSSKTGNTALVLFYENKDAFNSGSRAKDSQILELKDVTFEEIT